MSTLYECRLGRQLDRQAQCNPAAAIADYPAQYALGKNTLAPLFKQILANLIKYQKEYNLPICVHGRDGELIAQVALQAGILVKYALTSRVLIGSLAKLHPYETNAYFRYLKRVLPQECVHIDTGFEGSTPDRLSFYGWKPSPVKLVAASHKDRQMKFNMLKLCFATKGEICTKQQLVSIVTRLEHTPQRLTKSSRFDDLCYALTSPGFWAKFYGIADALGLPRAVGKCRATKANW